ncbi:Prephenate dehydratase [Segniliparus rotundus DSM 44985]|uniref:Prephenate dehydratase n=1 Tax=Segniliparus rotundus (strain ATCC BAA-972 / CDC 1076 / CIP 108378 / DSM 44985 / JCM 13578) TaxID=640132 RepID=D6ZB41_SEGRD|nr:prephenate dehydratase [Segniliparus rotundus]ADG96800.1 Prephenate dehydratase [Segniliparus rotundus DSM 44985]
MIAYFGPSGTFTEAAMLDFVRRGLAPDTGALALNSPQDVIAAVRDGTARYGCVPVESTADGSVAPTLDGLVAGEPVQIVAETQLEVSFSVLLAPEADPDEVATVAAYPVAAAQVRSWLAQRWPRAAVVPASSNAAAALDAAEGRADAAVTTPIMAERLSLREAARSVADITGSRTRFALISAPCAPPPRTGSDRTAVALRLAHAPGSLANAMNQLALRDLDLIRIESRPTRNQPEPYWFFLDFVGHVDDPVVAEALKSLWQHSIEVFYLGSWSCESFGGAANRPIGVPPPSDEAARRWVAGLRSPSSRP